MAKAISKKPAKSAAKAGAKKATFVCEESGNSFVSISSAVAPEAMARSTGPEAAASKPIVDQVSTTPNKSSRNGTDIDHIVIHYTTSNNLSGTLTHFKSAAAEVSAHYVVGQDGKLVQVVADSENAWHAGNKPMNKRSIGIEHVAAPGVKIKPKQAEKSAALIAWLMSEYGIPKSNVIPHVCVKPTSCCGDLFKDFGGAAGGSCSVQKTALHKWMTSVGIG